MKFFATIQKRRARVAGFKNSGWRVVDESTPLSSEVRDIDFIIKITDDGSDGFLLDYKSTNGEFCADSSHNTIKQAFESASDIFGVSASDWLLSQNIKRQK